MNIYFGKNLKEMRKERNLTQENIADLLGVSFQSVSKWERGESYPDITMLPVIASFFKVTVDELLGVNEAENEDKIKKYIYDIRCLTNAKEAYEIAKKAIAEFPGDFRLLNLYLFKLIALKGTLEEGLSILSEVRSIYDNIQQNCTVDSIRAESKKYLAEYYKTLTLVPNSGFTVADVKEIVDDMPQMRDSKEYLGTFLYPMGDDEQQNSCRDAIGELLLLLEATVVHYSFLITKSTEFKVKAVEKVLAVQNLLNEDGNYGKSWRLVMYNYGNLGRLYYELGNTEKSIENLRKCAELAKQFDKMPGISERHALLFEGSTFDKNIIGSTFVACQTMKRRMLEQFDFPEEFKASEEFREILNMLG